MQPELHRPGRRLCGFPRALPQDQRAAHNRRPGRRQRRPPGDTERGHVRPERVRSPGDRARSGGVRRHRPDGVRRERRHLQRHRPHAGGPQRRDQHDGRKAGDLLPEIGK